ncbi:expressed unknown protein [Seminavis robusta]|uniref:Uncharacterized protein n=1 Tax=Seminavis robusta TaxID=568900 RepID=A0A9N8ELZ7_9STRA|nr:expressed unknown protein [Seminavis robusta]|eukprot:Sro1511_g278730.1 n/a (177) ;mRNA; r:15419-15949
MTRFSALALLLAVPSVYGFGVAVPSSSAVVSSSKALFAVEDGAKEEKKEAVSMDKEDAIFMDSTDDNDEGFAAELVDFKEDEVEEEPVVVPTMTTTTTTSTDATVDETLSKAKDILGDVSSKAVDFAKDERVQEIAGKAKDFASDVMGQLFSKVGDKLKEIKKEKEERAAKEEQMK